MSDGVALLRSSDRICELVLSVDRLTVPDMQAMAEAVRSLAGNVDALVLRSTGPDFLLGRAASSEVGSAAEMRARIIEPIVGLYNAIARAPFPTVAAVGGRAAGLGFALALTCDVVIATSEAAFSLPEIDAGFAPLLALTQLAVPLPRPVAFHLAATAEPISGQRLWDLGTVAMLATADELRPTSRALAASFVARPAVRDIKTFLRRQDADRSPAGAARAADHLAAALADR